MRMMVGKIGLVGDGVENMEDERFCESRAGIEVGSERLDEEDEEDGSRLNLWFFFVA